MFCQFWDDSKELHKDKPILAIYANTSNEFMAMPKHVKYLCEWMEEKHHVKIQLEEVRAERNYVDVVHTEGYPVVSKKVSRMVRKEKWFLIGSSGRGTAERNTQRFTPRKNR